MLCKKGFICFAEKVSYASQKKVYKCIATPHFPHLSLLSTILLLLIKLLNICPHLPSLAPFCKVELWWDYKSRGLLLDGILSIWPLGIRIKFSIILPQCQDNTGQAGPYWHAVEIWREVGPSHYIDRLHPAITNSSATSNKAILRLTHCFMLFYVTVVLQEHILNVICLKVHKFKFSSSFYIWDFLWLRSKAVAP